MEICEDNVSIQNKTVEQEKAIQRRELRRRKILENAKCRMEKLNGRIVGDYSIKTDNEQFSDPEVEPNAVSSGNLTTAVDRNYEELLTSVFLGPSLPEPKKHGLLKFKFHIVLAVIIGYICCIFWNTSENGEYSMFIPAGITIAMDAIYLRERNQNNPIADVVATLVGLQKRKANLLFSLYYITQHLLVDLSIVVFLICCFGYMLTFASGYFVYLAKFK